MSDDVRAPGAGPAAPRAWRDPRHALLAAAGALLVVHSLAFDFVTDDAYISFVFARNLAEHGELSFNLGTPVEGYTNFLWTVVLGGLMALGVDPTWSARVLGTACALGTLVVAARLVERALGRRTPWAALPALLLASSSGYACWSSGGLETQLFTLLVTLALDAFVAGASLEPGAARPLRRMGVWLALASMTRPEGPMIAAVLGVTRAGHRALARRWRPTADELAAVAWFLVAWGPWFAWRWWYYGYPFPNTYYVKAHGPWASPGLAAEMRANGLYYLWAWLRQTRLLYALPVAALGLGAARPGTPRFALTSALALLAAVYAPYTVSVGGDFMGLHRFIMPLFVVAALAVTLGLERLARRAAAPAPQGSILASAVAALFAGAVALGFGGTQWRLTRESVRPTNLASDHGIDTPAFLRVYTEDRAAIGRALAPCLRADDFSIVGGAGAQPYFGRMRAIDAFGLVSERIAHGEPRVRARAGHTKFAGDAVLAAHAPTLVFSCYAIHPTTAQPALPCAGFWLARGFEQVTLHVPGMRQQGEYYTFLARKDRALACPGRVR